MTANPFFPVTKSFLSEVALAETIATAYGLSHMRGRLMAAFMRDVYQISSDKRHYVFYIYRQQQQRALDAIKAEMK